MGPRNTTITLRYWPAFRPGILGMLAAGLVGISVNTIVLKAATLLYIHPGGGALLQLMLLYAQRWSPWLLPALHALGLTKTPSLFGFLWYHYATGLGMILLYFYVFSTRLPGPRWWRATLFSFLPWLINSAIVLPQLGEGFAGLRVLPCSDALYFFFANWLFVVSSAVSYQDRRQDRV